MRRATAVLMALSAAAAPGKILDRIAVTVDNQLITESDIIRELRVDAFLDRKPVDLAVAAKREAAGRLVDQMLVLEEAADSHLNLASDRDASKLLQQVKAQYASDDEYRSALARYQISEADLSAHLLDGLRELRFTDLRFSPEVQIQDQDLRGNYNSLVADWSRTHPGQKPPSFEQSRDQIEKLLTGQRVMQLLDQWLVTARGRKHIEYRETVFQ